MSMRLFIGLDLPPEIKTHLISAMGSVAGARWQREDQLHLTLRFIGEADRHLAADIDSALAALHHPPIPLALEGAGVFGKPGRPETLWVGVKPLAPLRTLHNKVDQALSRVGLPPETRQYTPHITLARLRGRTGALDSFMAQSGGITSPSFLVGHICLFESRLSQEGSHYSILERYALTG